MLLLFCPMKKLLEGHVTYLPFDGDMHVKVKALRLNLTQTKSSETCECSAVQIPAGSSVTSAANYSWNICWM